MTACLEFPRRRIKYVATINDETLSEETDPFYELRYVDIGNVDSSGQIYGIVTYAFSEAPSRARRRVRDGDVIVSCVRTYLQAIAPIRNPPDNLVVSTGFAVVRPSLGVLGTFAKYALRDPYFLAEVEKRSVGVSYPTINTSDLRDISVRLPDAKRQADIADYLDHKTVRLDALIAAKERVRALLAEKRQAIITHAVTRGLNSGAALRLSGVAWLDEIPDEWQTQRAARLFRERDERGEPDLPLLEVSIKDGVVAREFSRERIETTAADFNTYKIARRGDVVFNKMRMWQGAVGVAPHDGLVSPDYTVAAATGALSPTYVGLLFRIGSFSAECARHSHGIVWDRLRLYWGGFREIKLPVPPPDTQQEIVDYVIDATAKLDALAFAMERTISLLKERRAALISEAVSGQLDVDRAA